VALFWFAFSLPFGGLNLLLTRTSSPFSDVDTDATGWHQHHRRHRGEHRPVQAVRIAGLIIGTVVANAVMTALQLHRLRIGFNGRVEGGQTTDDHRSHRRCLGVASRACRGSCGDCSTARSGVSLPAQIVSVGGAAAAGLLCTCARCSRCTCRGPSGAPADRQPAGEDIAGREGGVESGHATGRA